MCAIIRRGILGGFSNKIGNIVGTSWKGIAIMKSLPLSVANPRTTAQTTQRQAFASASKIGSALLASIIKPLWDRFAQQESGYNAFVQENIGIMEELGLFAPDSLVISKGKMAALDPLTATGNATADTITFTWSTVLPDAFSAASDLVYVVIAKDLSLDQRGYATGILRSAGTATISYTGLLLADQVWVCLAFKRADGTVVSNTGHRQITIS